MVMSFEMMVCGMCHAGCPTRIAKRLFALCGASHNGKVKLYLGPHVVEKVNTPGTANSAPGANEVTRFRS